MTRPRQRFAPGRGGMRGVPALRARAAHVGLGLVALGWLSALPVGCFDFKPHYRQGACRKGQCDPLQQSAPSLGGSAASDAGPVTEPGLSGLNGAGGSPASTAASGSVPGAGGAEAGAAGAGADGPDAGGLPGADASVDA